MSKGKRQFRDPQTYHGLISHQNIIQYARETHILWENKCTVLLSPRSVPTTTPFLRSWFMFLYESPIDTQPNSYTTQREHQMLSRSSLPPAVLLLPLEYHGDAKGILFPHTPYNSFQEQLWLRLHRAFVVTIATAAAAAVVDDDVRIVDFPWDLCT